MNSDMLISIDDADLDLVAGGAISGGFEIGRLGGYNVTVDDGKITTKITFLGKSVEFGLGLFARFF